VAGATRFLKKTGARRAGAAPSASGDHEKPPKPGDEYLGWLERNWRGDTRELREGRYLHQQADLRQAFETSDYWRELSTLLRRWSADYAKQNEARLFSGEPVLPVLASKPWESFLSRTWRENVGRNDRWPEEPPDGWWMPDNWFEKAWDVVRTRLVVRYMDGVEILAKNLVACAERRFKLKARLDVEAKQDGYYAFHVYISQPFAVAALDYEGKQERSSAIEIQVMTEMAAVISELTHTYYEDRREADPAVVPPLWGKGGEWLASALHYQSADLEKRILELRDEIRKRTTTNGSSRRRARTKRLRGE
jgi:ppGpp synthetase/RelA/SpoT-type nucleotidyltranferase